MYLSFYELDKKPFQISVDPMFLWMGEMHREALAMFKYGIMDNRGFIMLTGDVGTGKTTLVNALINNLGPDVIVANITNPGLKRLEFLNHLAVSFELGNTYSGKGSFLLAFRIFLEKCFRDGKQVLLIIDEAQRLSQDMLEEIRLLSNIEHQDVKLLNIFFVGQDELNDILERRENRALRQRMTLQYHLEPLSEKEIGQFITHRLTIAGTDKKIFTQDAIREIFAFSEGYPRLTNIICDHAMLAGYVANKKIITASEISDCAEDLKLPRIEFFQPPAAAHPPKAAYSAEKITEHPEDKSLSYLYPYIAVILFFFLLVCFLYFPIRAGASFSDIMNYWIDQISPPKLAISKQITETLSPQATFKIGEDAGRLENRRSEINGLRSETGGSERRSAEDPRSGTSEIEKTGSSEDESVVVSMDRQDDGLAGQSPGAVSYDPSTKNYALPSSEESIPESEKLYTLTFGFDSNDLTAEGYERLTKTAELMQANPEVTVIIQGHTDGFGSKTYNAMLSKFRADIAKNYLVSKGADPDKITSIGKGSEEPVADNDDIEGRRANRRVEVVMNIPN